jgi:hypothetical protein
MRVTNRNNLSLPTHQLTENNMSWKWLDALLGGTSKSSTPEESDTAGGGTLSEASTKRLSQLQESLKRLREGKAPLDAHIADENQLKQSLMAAASSGLNTSEAEMPCLVRRLLDEAYAHQHVLVLQKQLAEAKAKADRLKAGNELGEHRDELMALADKLVTSRERADFAWLMMQMRISTGRMELGWAKDALSDAEKKHPEIASVIAEIEELLGPKQSVYQVMIRPDRA